MISADEYTVDINMRKDIRQSLIDHARLLNKEIVRSNRSTNVEDVEDLIDRQACILYLLDIVNHNLRLKQAPKKRTVDTVKEEFKQRLAEDINDYFEHAKQHDESIDVSDNTLMDFGVFIQLKYYQDLYNRRR